MTAPAHQVEGERLAFALTVAAMRRDFAACGALVADAEPLVVSAALLFAVALAAHAGLKNAQLTGVDPERVISSLRESIINLETT